MRYSTQLRKRKYAEGYDFLSLQENLGINTVKKLIYHQKTSTNY